MTTLQEIKTSFLGILSQQDEGVAPVPIPATTTSTAADSVSLRDTVLGRGTTNANRYDGRQIEVWKKVGSGPAVGAVSAVDDAGFDNTDKLTLSPAFSTPIESGADYAMYPRGITPEMALRAVNDVVRGTDVPHLWVPSMVPDSDFELDPDDITTYWNSVGAPTKTFQTSGTLLGERIIYLIATADEGLASDPFEVTEGEQLLVSVTMRTTTADDSGKAVLYDETNSADIESATIDERLYTEARFVATVADDMERARIRVLGTVAGLSYIYISPPVIVQSFAGRAYGCPSWLVDPENQVMEAVYLPQGFTSEAENTYIALSERVRRAPMPTFLRGDRWVTPVRVELKASSAGPVGLVCKRTVAEFSANSDARNIDRQYVAHKAVSLIKKARGDRDSRGALEWPVWARSAAARARQCGYGGKAIRWAENETVLVR